MHFSFATLQFLLLLNEPPDFAAGGKDDLVHARHNHQCEEGCHGQAKYDRP